MNRDQTERLGLALRKARVCPLQGPAPVELGTRSCYHLCGKLIYIATRISALRSATTTWIVPARCAIWIPPAAGYQFDAFAAAAVRNAYIPRRWCHALPTQCRVIVVSPVLRELLSHASSSEGAAEGDLDRRDELIASVLADQVKDATEVPLQVKMPGNRHLLASCARFLLWPSLPDSIDTCAEQARMSASRFARTFRQETGLSCSDWRRRMRVVLSLPQLATGVPLKEVASEVGYRSPSAFSTMFKHVVGRPPSDYFNLRNGNNGTTTSLPTGGMSLSSKGRPRTS